MSRLKASKLSACHLFLHVFAHFLLYCAIFVVHRRQLVENLIKTMGAPKKCENCGAVSPGIRKDGSNKLFQVRVVKRNFTRLPIRFGAVSVKKTILNVSNDVFMMYNTCMQRMKLQNT